jgi:phage I-like protein
MHQGRRVATADALGRLAVSVETNAAGELPTEFRLFAPGVNRSENGDYLFDAAAAESVMSSFGAHGVDKMIDLEHLSLDAKAPHFDPDARGWFTLELRDGELWAVNVRWNADGAARLTDKRQRYVSPAFAYDPKSGRVTKIVNVAITAMPATHGTAALVAARTQGDDMDPKQIEAVMKAAGLDPKMMTKVAVALGLDAGADADAVKAAIDSFAEKMKKIEDLLSEGEKTDADEKPSDAPPPAAEPPPEAMAAANRIVALTGRASLADSVAAIESWRESHLALESDRAKLEADRAKLEGVERRGLVAQLVKAGFETPATAWSDDNGSVPAEHLAAMSIAGLRDRVAKLTGSRSPAPARVSPPVAGPDGLTDSQIKLCKDSNVDPQKFAALKAQRDAARTGRS